MNGNDAPQAGRRVLVTRPSAQADALCSAIRAHGWVPVRLPLLEIVATDDPSGLASACDRLEQFDIAFFVSPNAVEHALAFILARRGWPTGLIPVTVGMGSKGALLAHGLSDAVAPEQGFDSESVLALPLFQAQAVRGRNVVVFRGNGGRDLLGETLRERGAQVEYVSAYARRLPPVDVDELSEMAERGELDAITLTSSEAVRHLAQHMSAHSHAALANVPVFVPHPRIAEHARAAGFVAVHETLPGDEGLIVGLESLLSISLG